MLEYLKGQRRQLRNMQLYFENSCKTDEILDNRIKENVISEVTEEKQLHYLPLK